MTRNGKSLQGGRGGGEDRRTICWFSCALSGASSPFLTAVHTYADRPAQCLNWIGDLPCAYKYNSLKTGKPAIHGSERMMSETARPYASGFL